MVFHSILKIYPYILYGTSIVFLFSGIRAVSDYRLHKDKSVFNYIGLSFSCFVYDFMLSLAFFNPNPKMAMIVSTVNWVAASALYTFYFRQISNFINDYGKSIRFVLNFTQSIFVIAVANLILYLTTGESFLYYFQTRNDAAAILVACGANFLQTTKFAEFLGALSAFIPMYGIIYVALVIRKNHPKETLLKLGAALSLVSFFNEMALTFNVINSISLFFLSKGFEIFRFGRFYQIKALQKINTLEDEVNELSLQASTAFIAGGITHDINNPLTIILLSIKSLKDGIVSSEIQREPLLKIVNRIDNQSTRIAQIIKDYLQLMRNNGKTSFETALLSTIINNALILSEHRRNSAGIDEVILSQTPTDIKLLCNATQIELVIANLLNNAADAMKDLTTERRLEIKANTNPSAVILDIIDSGHLPVEIEKVLFKKSMSTKKEMGNGIGLRIAQKIINKHNGTISFIRLENGSCFRITLPIC